MLQQEGPHQRPLFNPRLPTSRTVRKKFLFLTNFPGCGILLEQQRTEEAILMGQALFISTVKDIKVPKCKHLASLGTGY
jgi:hypothetical protein